jgi:hypothetical protein
MNQETKRVINEDTIDNLVRWFFSYIGPKAGLIKRGKPNKEMLANPLYCRTKEIIKSRLSKGWTVEGINEAFQAAYKYGIQTVKVEDILSEFPPSEKLRNLLLDSTNYHPALQDFHPPITKVNRDGVEEIISKGSSIPLESFSIDDLVEYMESIFPLSDQYRLRQISKTLALRHSVDPISIYNNIITARKIVESRSSNAIR